MYTLVIVDMQRTFLSFPPKTTTTLIKACQREIVLAKRRNCGIVFLEFGEFGNTISELKQLVNGYSKAYFSIKYYDDGSGNVRELIERHNLHPDIRIIGVNTSYCVYETVAGLLKQQRNISVIADACNCSNHLFGIKKLALLNVKIFRH